jgi:hypothetical protein
VKFWTWSMVVSCFNGNLTYWTENINCISNYVLQDWICVADICKWDAPEFSISNWTQKAWTNWSPNVTAGDCTYVCKEWFYSNWTSCVAAAAGNFVAFSWATSQTQCAVWSYQTSTGQTSCITATAWNYVSSLGQTSQAAADAGYYASSAWATGQIACTAWNYQNLTGQSSCKTADAGNYAVWSAAIKQDACAAWSYQDLTGQSSCKTADAGNFVLTTWQTGQTQCVLWSYQPTAWQSSCIPAGTWQYVDMLWQSVVKSCTANPGNSTYNPSSWLTSNSCTWTCNSTYHNESNQCVSDTKSCTIANWVWWTQSWNWSTWWACSIVSCNAWYYNNWSACIVQWSWDATSWFVFKNTSWVEQYPTSCNNLLTVTTWKNTYAGSPWNSSVFTDWNYWLKPSGTPVLTNCDMSTSWWWWNLVLNLTKPAWWVACTWWNAWNIFTTCNNTTDWPWGQTSWDSQSLLAWNYMISHYGKNDSSAICTPNIDWRQKVISSDANWYNFDFPYTVWNTITKFSNTFTIPAAWTFNIWIYQNWGNYIAWNCDDNIYLDRMNLWRKY